jgi:PPM family protein phosphatase
VADGMGGAAAGEVASRLALTTLLKLVLDTPDWIFRFEDPEVQEVLDRTARRFREVNAAVLAQARRDPNLAGMGTTLTLAWNLGVNFFIAHVGDSRGYLFRQGRLYQLTRDHSIAQALADHGMIKPEEVATHRLRHVLTHAIGAESGDNPVIQRLKLADGDRILVCTDGLTDMVDDAAIAAQFGRQASAAEMCQSLIDLALQGGGKDITVVVADYRIPEA